jgi:hypothetical protein
MVFLSIDSCVEYLSCKHNLTSMIPETENKLTVTIRTGEQSG